MRTSKIGVIEVLVILGGIAVAAAIVVPNFIRGHRTGGVFTACKSNCKNIGTALEMYSTDWEGKYPSDMASLIPNYLKVIPECPAAGTDTYSRFYSNSPMVAKDSLQCRTHLDDSDKACVEKQRLVLDRLRELDKPELTSEVIKGTDATCPDGQPYRYNYWTNAYSFCCSGLNHGSIDVAADYPKYDVIDGLVERP